MARVDWHALDAMMFPLIKRPAKIVIALLAITGFAHSATAGGRNAASFAGASSHMFNSAAMSSNLNTVRMIRRPSMVGNAAYVKPKALNSALVQPINNSDSRRQETNQRLNDLSEKKGKDIMGQEQATRRHSSGICLKCFLP